MLALLGVTSSPAEATAVTNTYLSCDSGGSEAMCFMSWTGGTLPFTISWLFDQGLGYEPWPESDNAQALWRTCWANHTYRVKVTVTDVHGHG
ncbi:MAG: hypothetical protein ACM30G_16945, partial [Micromonosporaceae bacterium]